MRRATYCVYILSNASRTLYVGVTNDLVRRVWEHKEGTIPGFTARYHVKQLVWFEQTENVLAAIEREKQIKSWVRKKKIALVSATNPQWLDLAADESFFAQSGDLLLLGTPSCHPEWCRCAEAASAQTFGGTRRI